MLTDINSRYKNYIQANKFKFSKRRDLIFGYVSKTSGHFTADHIYREMMEIDPGIGIATVYRTIRLLVECGILTEHTFGEKKGYFELNQINARHHDHLICTSCGKIIEFQCDVLEEEKERIAEQYQFKIDSHKIEIFGICNTCRREK